MRSTCLPACDHPAIRCYPPVYVSPHTPCAPSRAHSTRASIPLRWRSVGIKPLSIVRLPSHCRPIRTELHARAVLLVPTLEVRKARAHARTRAREGWNDLIIDHGDLWSETSISAWLTLICRGTSRPSNIKPLPICFPIAIKLDRNACNALILLGIVRSLPLCADHMAQRRRIAMPGATQALAMHQNPIILK